MSKNKFLRTILATLLPVGSRAAEDEAVDVNALSEDDFDKEFEKMMSSPVEEEDTTPSVEDSAEPQADPEPDPEPTEPEPEEDGEPQGEPEDDGEKNALEPEQQEDEPVEGEEPEVDSDDKPETEGETDDSATKETKSVDFDFSAIPMDELLPMDIPVNGTKVKATVNELIEGFKKGMNYTQKMQELAPLRKSMSIVSSNDISEEQLNLLVEVQKGNKEALSKLIDNSGIDPLELDDKVDTNYTPADYSKEEMDVDMEMATKEILADKDYGEIVQNAVTTMPGDMYDAIKTNSSNLRALHEDVKAGIYQEVMPEVMKLQTLYGIKEPTMDTYLKVANQLMERKQAETPSPVQEEEVKTKATQRSAQRKKAGSSAKANKKESFIQKDIDSLGEDDFDAEFAKITGRSIDDYK